VTILNTLDPLGKFDGKADEEFLVGYSNTDDDDATFEVKEPEFKVEKLESEVHVSPSNSDKTKKHDDKTKREAKGKSPVELSTGFRNLSEEFEDFSDDSTNEVNAASTPVLAVGQISTNNTNTFSAYGPLNTIVSLTLRESLYVDPSQYPDDPNMPALEDITYSNDEEDVGAEADFTNLETTITVSPIPTTRVHKDHPVKQIIGDLSLTTQTRSMTRMVKDQGESIDYEEVFAPVARIKAISSAKAKKHDDKTNKETKGKSHVEFTPVPAVGQISTNSTNTFSAAGPSNTAVIYDRYQSGEGCHVVPPPYTGTFMPPKPDMVFYDAPTVNKSLLTVFNVEPSPAKPNKDLS
nr:hypothetical protein [Tanacetum cinerariifolium]